MIKAKGKAGGRGGKSRSTTAGGSVTREKKMQTSANEHLMTLRAALYDDTGADRNVLAPFAVSCASKRAARPPQEQERGGEGRCRRERLEKGPLRH